MFQFKELIGTVGYGLEAAGFLVIIVDSIASSVHRLQQIQNITSSGFLGIVR